MAKERSPESVQTDQQTQTVDAPPEHVNAEQGNDRIAFSTKVCGAWNTLAFSLKREWIEVQQRTAQSHLELRDRLLKAQSEAYRPVQEAYLKVIEAQRAAWVNHDRWPEYEAAVREYSRAVINYQTNRQFRDDVAGAYENYSRVERELSDELHARSLHAYREYWRDLKAAWAELDTDKLEQFGTVHQ